MNGDQQFGFKPVAPGLCEIDLRKGEEVMLWLCRKIQPLC